MRTSLDSPSLRERTRVYLTLTNKCNRSCPWCSVYSSPEKSVFLTLQGAEASLPSDMDFDLQIEGGEPTIHPKFMEFITQARSNPRVHDVVLVTNGTKLPRDIKKLKTFIESLGSPLKLKLSINHYLLDRDPGLIELSKNLVSIFRDQSNISLIFNVRLRKGKRYQNDQSIRDLVVNNGLEPYSNIFYLQKYGLASDIEDWDEPHEVTKDFILINPDGVSHTNLLQRSEAMRLLP